MQPRESQYPHVPTAEERRRSRRVVKFWGDRPTEWESRLRRFDEEWSVEAIDRKRQESEHSRQRERLGFAPSGFHVHDPNSEPFARLKELLDHLLQSRPPYELPLAEREDQALWILFVERAISDPDLEMYGAGTSADAGLPREWVRWSLGDREDHRKAWAERVEEALDVMEDAGPETPLAVEAWKNESASSEEFEARRQKVMATLWAWSREGSGLQDPLRDGPVKEAARGLCERLARTAEALKDLGFSPQELSQIPLRPAAPLGRDPVVRAAWEDVRNGLVELLDRGSGRLDQVSRSLAKVLEALREFGRPDLVLWPAEDLHFYLKDWTGDQPPAAPPTESTTTETAPPVTDAPKPKRSTPAERRERLARMAVFRESNPKATLEETAAHVGCSASALSRTVKALLGVSWKQLVREGEPRRGAVEAGTDEHGRPDFSVDGVVDGE